MSHDLTPRALVTLPEDALWAPWTLEWVYQLNRRQADERASTYRCPNDGIELWATVDGWMCARATCSFRQPWVPERGVRPFVPPPRSGT